MIKSNVSINLRLFAQRFPKNRQHKRNVILFIPNTSHLADYHIAPLISLDSVIDRICGSLLYVRATDFFFFFLEKKKKKNVRIVEFDLRSKITILLKQPSGFRNTEFPD